MANVGAGVFQGMPVSTSLSASSLNESSGARSQLSSLISGALVIGTLLVLAPLFSHLPKAVLGAVIIDAVVFGMIDVAGAAPAVPRDALRLLDRDRGDRRRAVCGRPGRRRDRRRALAGLAGLRATRPPMPLLGREQGTQVFRDFAEHDDDETFPGIVVLRLDGGLFFATAEALENRIRGLADDGSPPTGVVLSLEGVNFVDSQGAAKLRELHDLAERTAFELRLARLKPQVRDGARGRRHRRPDRRRPHPRQRPPRRGGPAQPRAIPSSAADGCGSGSRIILKDMNRPSRPARAGISSAT